jgi:ketosteroid isomerase-like protein
VTRENVEILRSAYEALNHGDVESALSVLHDDAEWREHSDLPEADAYRGREAIHAFLLGYLDSWDEFHQETEDLIAAGDRVAVLLRMEAKGKGSGIEVEGRYAHLWTMRDGKGVRVDAYADCDRALEALHDREPTTPR